MKVLIAYATRGGATAEIARMIAGDLSGRGIEAEMVEIRGAAKLPFGDYDAVILGASINAGMIQNRMKRFSEAREDELCSLPLYIYVSCLAQGEEARGYIEQNFSPRLNAHSSGRFAPGGIINFARLPWIKRFILKKMAGIDGDRREIREVEVRTLCDAVSQVR